MDAYISYEKYKVNFHSLAWFSPTRTTIIVFRNYFFCSFITKFRLKDQVQANEYENVFDSGKPGLEKSS